MIRGESTPPLEAALPVLPDYCVLTRAQVAAATGLSIDTLKRMAKDHSGPPLIMLSEKRIGYPVGALRKWLTQRTQGHENTAA